MTDRYLDGVHALITGGSRGIGAAVAEALGECGARLTIMARSARALGAHAAVLESQGREVQPVECDVTDQASVERAFAQAQQAFGPVGVLVNNAGTAISAAFGATTRDLWDRMLAVNLTGTYLCTSQVLPRMMALGEGRIINVASTAGLRGYRTMTAYCAAKHGVVGFTRALAQETAKHGITVNAVCPGYTDTDLTETAVSNLVSTLGKTPDEARSMLVRIIPRGVLTTPGEVAAAVAWLCAPNSRAVTGIALPVAGGEVG